MQSYASRIDLRHLRYFVAIVRCGSFRAAAEQLHISQPPLTRQIQQLEQVLGTTLLHRGAGGVTTTDAGAAFCTEAENILGLFEQACESTRLIGGGLLGRLDVGVFGSAVLDIVPRIVLAFRQRFPDVEVILHNMDRETQIKALQERRILIGFNRFFVDHPDLHWEPVVHETMLVAAPSTHPLAARDRVSLRDLAGEPLIFYPRTSGPGGFSNYLLRHFHALDIEPTVVQHVDDVVTAVAFVSSGLGLTLGVESARNLRLPGVTYIELEEGESSAFDLSVIYRAGEHSQLLDAFLAAVRAVSAVG
jgi:molybdate transport repressor ModE-like protein